MLVTVKSSCICCNLLFLRETNGRCERFQSRELPRPTSGVSSIKSFCNWREFRCSIEGLATSFRLTSQV